MRPTPNSLAFDPQTKILGLRHGAHLGFPPCDALSLERVLSGTLAHLSLLSSVTPNVASASVSWGCHNHTPQAGRPEPRKSAASQFWRREVQEQDVGRSGSSRGLLPWLAGGLLLTVCACGLSSVRGHVCPNVPSQRYQGSTPTTSFNLKRLFKGDLSKYSHFPRFWGLGLQHVNQGGEHSSACNNFIQRVLWSGLGVKMSVYWTKVV